MDTNGILISTTEFRIIREVTYDKDKRVDGMYYKVGNDLIPAAYIFPIENREAVQSQLDTLKTLKKIYDDEVAKIYYKVFPKLR